MGKSYAESAKKWRELQDKKKASSNSGSNTPTNSVNSKPTSTGNSSYTKASNSSTSKPRSYAESAKKWRELKDKNLTPTQKWEQQSNRVLSDIQSYYSDWRQDRGEKKKYYNEQIDSLIESADQWRIEHDGNEDALNAIDSIVKGLSSGKKLVEDSDKYYSQWDTEDAYRAFLKQQEEYENKWGKYTKESDFADYAKKGAAIKNPSVNDAEGYGYFFGWRPGAEDVGNIVTYSRDNYDSILLAEKQGAHAGTVGKSLYNQMKDEEVELYNYILAKQGKEAAQKYLDDIEESLNARLGATWGENVRNIENPLLRTAATGLYGFTSGMDQFASGARQFFTNEEQDTSAMQFGSQYIQQDLATKDPETGEVQTDKQNLKQMLYGATTTIGNMAPSILVSSLVGPVAGAVGLGAKGAAIAANIAGASTMGMSASGNAYKQALDAGYDQGKARNYSLLVGGAEAALQYALGGIGKLGGVTEEAILSKVAAVDDVLARFALTGAVKLGGEILEEELQEFLEPLFKTIVFNEKYDAPTAREMFETALMTAISTGVLEGASIHSDTFGANKAYNNQYSGRNAAYEEALAKYLNEGKTEKEAAKLAKEDVSQTFTGDHIHQQLNETADAMVKETLEVDPENKKAKQIQQRLADNKDVSGYSINLLSQQNEQALRTSDKSKIQKAAVDRLTKLGATEDVESVAAALAKQAAGEKLTKSEQDLIDKNRYAPMVAKELDPKNIRSGLLNEAEGYSTEWAEKLDTDRINVEEYSRLVEEAQLDNEVTNEVAVAEEISAPEIEEGKAILNIGNQVENVDFDSVNPISAIKNGRMVLRLADGRTVSSESVTHASEDVNNVFSIAQKLAPDTRTANVMVNGFKPGMNAETYIKGIQLVHMYGKLNSPMTELLRSGSAKQLPVAVRDMVYKAGQIAGGKQIAAEQAKLNASKVMANPAKNSGITINLGGGEVMSIDEYIKNHPLKNEVQKSGIAYMKLMNTVLGTEYDVFESYIGKNGKRMRIDEDGKEVSAPNGFYDGKIHTDLNAGQFGEGTILYTVAHESTHDIRKWSPAKFKTLANTVIAKYGEAGISVEKLIAAQQEKAARAGRTLDEEAALEEVVADAMQGILKDGKVAELVVELRKKDMSLAERVTAWFTNLLNKFKATVSAYKDYAPDSIEGRMILDMEKSVIEQIEQLYAEGLVDAAEAKGAPIAPGVEGVEVNTEGDPVAYATEDGTVMLSLRTYEEDGRDAFRKYLEKCVKNDKLTKAEMNEMMDDLEGIYTICKDFKDKYAPFGSWSDAAVVRDTRGKPVFSVVTPNGDYKMNLDFSLVCKKRRTLDAVFNEMAKRGIIDDFELGQKSVVKINEMIRKHGFETACALCFVDAKRFRQASMADSFTNLYNELVTSLVPEDQQDQIDHYNFSGYQNIKSVEDGIHTWDKSKLDFSHINHVLKTYGSGTVEYKAANYIKNHAEGRRLLLRGDFMSSEGFDAVKSQNPNILKLYNSKKGTGGPKAAFGDVQYMNEIIKKARTWTPAKAYAVGGVRIQSFSDYVPRMVFDYVQMIYDLAATKLPAHAYTKEELFVKQFGLTGVKINMSLIPAIAEGGIAPGLDADGNYVWAGESFDYETAKEIQNAEGYTENCGTICVGVSHKHIDKLLSDPNIRMVIPYHKSGLNPIVAHMNKIAEFTDYTKKQNTTVKATGSVADKHFDFNAELHKMGENADPKAVIEKYFDWCDENGYDPKFAEFRYHPNYYKLIEDFTLYDKDGKYVPQREVRAVFPKEGSPFGSMKDLIQAGLEEDAIVEGKRDKSLSEIVDEIERTLPKTEAEIAEEQVEQADRDLEADVKNSLRDAKIPTREELNAKDPIKVVDISESMTTGTYAERRRQIMQRAQGVITKPYLNRDTNTMIFLTERSYTHAFNNIGNIQLNAVEHLPEFIENAVLTHAEPPEYGNEHTDAVYTFFAAARAKNVLPVKLKVKEYRYEGQMLPKNIQAYFENHPEDFASLYDTVVLEVEEIKEDTSGSAGDITTGDDDPDPNMSSDIKVTDLLDLVKGNAEKYIPKLAEKLSDRDTVDMNNAVERFGTTTDFNEVGFILPSGKMLKFTDDDHRGERLYDHRAIGLVYGVEVDLNVNHGFNEESNEYLDDFVEDGGIRFDPGDLDLDMDAGMQLSGSKPLTREQERAIRDFIEWKKQREESYNPSEDDPSLYDGPLALHIDFGGNSNFAVSSSSRDLDAWGVKHLSYEGGQINADRIIADIRHYYKTGEIREPSSIAQFRYSDRDFPNNAEDIAKDYFGTTTKWSETGWLLRDGTQLDFSGRHWERDPESEIDLGESFYSGKRNMEHYEIAEAFPELREFSRMEYRGEHLDGFMRRGNIRIVGKGMIGLETMPTEAQFEKLHNYFRENINRYMVIGVGTAGLDFREGTSPSTVIEGIRDYFSRNRQNQSELMRFHTMFSDRDGESVSNRALLANAFEGAVTNDIEKAKLEEYKGTIDRMNAEEQKLQRLNAKIKELSFAKGARDTARIDKLRTEAQKTANRINTYDKQLLRFEASKPLQNVLEREKAKAYARAEKKGKAALKKQREGFEEKSKQMQKELSEKYREKKQELVDKHHDQIAALKEKHTEQRENERERRNKTAMRGKIRKVIGELDNLLNHGNKKTNVKAGMQEFAASTIASAKVLFPKNDEIPSNVDMVREGIGVVLTEAEREAYNKAREILAKLDNLPVGSLEAIAQREELEGKLNGKLSYQMNKLKDALHRERIRINEAEVNSVLGTLADEYAKLKDSEQKYIKSAYSDTVYNYIKLIQNEIGGAKVMDMTLEQLEDLYRAYTMALTTVRDANNLFLEGKSVEETVENLVTEVERRKMPKTKAAAIARNLSNKIGWDYEKLYYALQRIGSNTLTELFTNLANAEDIVLADVAEADAKKMDIIKRYGYNNWNVDQKLNKVFMDTTGKRFQMTLGELMSLYAYSRRAGAWNHIEYGGFVFNKTALTDTDPVTTYKLNKEQCEAITNTLTEEQKHFVEEMQTFLSETMGAKGNEVSMKLYGVEMFGEKNYFPVHVAGQFMVKAQESQAKAAAGFSSMTNAGFTQAQNKKAKAPFIMESFMEVWADHVNEMSRYHGTVPALEDIRKVMNYSSYSNAYAESVSVQAILENKYGKKAVQYFNDLYQEANSGAITDKLQPPLQPWISKFRKNSVAYSASVLIQQPASIVRAYAMLPMKYFRGKGVLSIPAGVGQAIFNHSAYKKAYGEMLKYAPGVTLSKEIGGFDTASGNSIRTYLLDTGKNIKQKWKTETDLKGRAKTVMDVIDDNPIANLPNVADKIAWIEIWNACKRETAAKNKDLNTSSDAFMKLVGERFTEVIRATQVYDSMFSKSPLLRHKNPYVQMLVNFMNEPNTTANMVENAIRTAARGDGKTATRTITAVAGSVVFTCVLKSLVYAMRDEDEDKKYIEKYLGELTNNLISDFTVFNYIPVARDIWSTAQGFDVERSDMAIISDIMSAIIERITLAAKDTDEMTEDELIEFDKKVIKANMSMLDSVCAAFGIPEKNIRREIKAILNTAGMLYKKSGGKASWASIEDSVLEGVKGASPSFMGPKIQSKGDKLYEAIISGDTAYADRLKGTYKDEDAVTSAIRKALGNNEPRILKAAELLVAQDYDEGLDLIDEIVDEGKFTWNDVVSAVNTKVNKLTEDESDEDTAEKTKSAVDAKAYINAILSGSSEDIAEVRESILYTKIENGKTEDEAKESLVSSAKTELKDRYVAEEISKQQVLSAMKTIGADKVEETVNKWTCEVATGISYEDQMAKYKAGNTSVSEYGRILTKYGGLSEEKAAEKIVEDSKAAYKDGTFDRNKMISILINYGGKDSAKAESTVQYMDYKLSHPDVSVDDAWIDKYNSEVKDSGINLDMYIEYKNQVKSIDGEGKKERRMAVIHSLPISNAQKDALYYSEGWTQSRIHEAPWH